MDLSAFTIPDFLAPRFLSNRHVQTICGAVCKRPPQGFSYSTRIRLETKDGDFIDVDCSFHEDDTVGGRVRPAGIVLHGLESCSQGVNALELSNMLFRDMGVDVYALNFRGCSGALNKTHKSYHLGETEDLKLLIEHISGEPYRKDRAIVLTGFSLGGNVLCKYLGESPDHAATHHVIGAAAYCVPLDALASQPVIDSGLINRSIYSRRFVRSIQQKLVKRTVPGPRPYSMEKVLQARTLGEIDDAYIAPTYGFRDRFDYYRQCASGPFLKRVSVPLLIIQAGDDPFFDNSKTPDFGGHPYVRLFVTTHGGHCGYFAGFSRNSQSSSWIGEQFSRWFRMVFSDELRSLQRNDTHK